MPLHVTIGLPVYNGEPYIENAIRSILAQSLGDFELVISDNASTDATGAICKDYSLMDERVTYHRQDANLGCRANFHTVFGLAPPARYYKWASADDRIERDYLARCVGHLDDHPGDVLCQTLLHLVDGRGNPWPDPPVPSAFAHPSPHARLRALFEGPKTYQTFFGVWRRDALARSHLLGPWYAADRALLIEMSLLGGFGQVPERLYVSCDHEARGDYVDDVLDWYAPERGGEPEAGYWHHLWWVTRSLATMPMSPAERLRCLGELGRRASSKTGEWLPILAREAAEVAASRTRGPRPAEPCDDRRLRRPGLHRRARAGQPGGHRRGGDGPSRTGGCAVGRCPRGLTARPLASPGEGYRNMYSNRPWPTSPSTS